METIDALRGRGRGAWLVAAIAVAIAVGGMPLPARADMREGEMVRYPMTFPVDGDHYFSDTYGVPRSGGRTHKGQDILAAKGTPVVAVASGIVRYVNWTTRSHLNPDRCCSVVVRHDDGWESRYLHLNNDSPGTDDGKAWGIAELITPGTGVEAGQLLGWTGDSGNAEGTPSHLHLELIDPSGVHANSFLSLLLAGGNPPPTTASEDSLLGAEVLSRGHRGEDVARLQELLAGLGHSVGAVDGIFGPVTAAAVMAFQSDLGLAVDGLVGPQTRGAAARLLSDSAEVLGLGSRGTEVEEAQKLLAALGYTPGRADGIFGPRTLDAVLAFQRQSGLQVDGLVGPQTKARLGIR